MADQVNIVSPDQPDDAVVALPPHQHPYGDPCPLNRRFQSVLWHYDVTRASADVLINRNIHSIKQIRFINPDAGARTDQRKLYKEIVEDGIADPLQRYLVSCALRRMLLPDPFAAIVRVGAGASRSNAVNDNGAVDAANGANGANGADPNASALGGCGSLRNSGVASIPGDGGSSRAGGALPASAPGDSGSLRRARRAGRTDDVVRFSYKKVLGPQESDLLLARSFMFFCFFS